MQVITQVFIGNIVNAGWKANRWFGSINKILLDKANKIFVHFYHTGRALHDS